MSTMWYHVASSQISPFSAKVYRNSLNNLGWGHPNRKGSYTEMVTLLDTQLEVGKDKHFSAALFQ